MNHDSSLRRILQQLGQIEPHSESTRRAIDRARGAVHEQTASSPAYDWRNLIWSGKIAAAATGLAVVSALTLWFALAGTNTSVAFAEVQGRVAKARSVQFIKITRDKPKEGKPTGPGWEERVMILGRYLKRTEVLSVTPGDELEDGREWGHPLSGFISIRDAENGKNITLNPERKSYQVHNQIYAILEDGSLKTEKIKPHPEVDFYEQMRRVPTEMVTTVPELTIGGRKVIGFRVERKTERERGTDTLIRTYWVDPETKLPVQIEAVSLSTDPFHGQQEIVWKDIVFDAPLDKALFSTNPPEGYSAIKSTEGQGAGR